MITIFEGEVTREFHYAMGFDSLEYPPEAPTWERDDMLQQILYLIPDDNTFHRIKITVETFDD